MKYFKSIVARLICLFVLAFAGYSRADDVVGVVRIDANTNGLVEVEMPFEPMGNTGPSGFVAGLFTGDGSLSSDLLFCRSAVSGVLTNAIWNGFNWLDPTTSFLSSMSVRAGDTLYFLRSDEEPFSFSLFGRHPAFLQSQELPRFSSICVDPTNETVALSVLSENCVYDVFSCDLTNVSSSTYYPWMHIARRFSPLAQTELADFLPIIGYARFYSVSDAALDADGDGISDALETFVYKTNPHLLDSDGDGISDGCEIAWGTNPLFVENASPFCWSEGFEKPNVVPGDVDGQNGWRASGGISPKVVEEFSFEGAASLALLGGADSKSKVVRDVELDSEVVWVDMRGYSLAILDMEEGIPDSVCLFARNEYGQIVAFDGDVLRSDSLLKVDELDWIRVTFCINYRTRKWDLYVNGIIAYSQLGLRGNAERLNQIGLEGGGSFVDNISITTTRPKGLSSDGDDMPDEWELSAFGTLERDGSGDFDLDGLSDADEAAHNTDPLNPDTDGDSIFDSWEVANALDPLDGSDATLDPDGDGMSNLLESQLGSNPAFYEPDPRLMTAGLYVEFFQTSAAQSGIPDFNWLNPIGAIVAETIDWREGSWPECAALRGDYFACRAAGYVCIPKSGEYVFYVDSDDGMCLYVDGKCVVSDAAPHASREVSGKVMLEAGWRPIELHYYENTSAAKLVLSWSGPKFVKTVVPSSSFCHVPAVVEPPRGFAFGLEASLYSFQNALTAMPDFSSLTPDCKIVASSIAYSSTAEPWAGMPETMADRFAAVFEGFLIAEEAGRYDIALNSDDGSRLYIDGKPVIDNGGNHSMRKMLATVVLSEGLHSLRLEYYENTDHAGLELSWAPTGGALVPVQPHSLCRQVANIDSDSDGLPDWWEEKYGFDFLSPVDATLDPDNDGLDNLGEFSAGSNPHLPDTDSDGMPDAWEAKNGTLPFIVDTLEDPDSDGLVNVEEYRHGTNPLVADTDGDLVKDGDERNMYFSDPTIADFTAIVDTNAVVAASAVDETFGDWVVRAGGVSLLGRSGTLFYTNDLVLSHAGVRQLRLSCEFAGKYDTELVCKVDGVLSGVARLRASSVVQPAEAVFLTQWLNPGQHEMSFELQNFANESKFSLLDIAVCEPQGPDSDSDGIPDWINARMRNSSVWRPGNVASKVSPYCLRGDSASEVLPSVLTSGGDLSVGRLPYHGWYADVPLSTSGETVVSVSYENGMKQESVAVDWAEFDVTSEEDTVIRQGDSLLLSLGGAIGTVEVDGTVVSSDGSAVPWRFNSCGDHSVTGRSGGSVRTVTVRVVTCTLPDSIPLWRGKTSSVAIPGSGFSDMYLSFGPDAALASAILAGNVCTVSLTVPAFGHPTSLSCEIENPDASVVASAETLPFSVCYTLDGVYHVSHRLDAGTRVVENRLTAFGLPPGVELRMTGNSGICFEDGSGVLSLDCGDFDETGDCLYRFLVPEGVSNPCQFLHVYFDGKEFAQ